MEFELLSALARNPGRKMSRDEIQLAVRGIDAATLTRSVDIAVSRLRHKIRDTGRPARYIKTVWGHGYVFVGEPVAGDG